jgi:predicted GNAT family acetyltransferase
MDDRAEGRPCAGRQGVGDGPAGDAGLTPTPTGDPDVFDNSDEHRYEIYSEGELAGLVTYTSAEDHIVFNHAETRPPFEGRGLGARMVKAALDDARRQGTTVKPSCPFVAEYIRGHPEYDDLVNWRNR